MAGRGGPKQHFKQVAEVAPLNEGMAQGKARNHLVTASASVLLADPGGAVVSVEDEQVSVEWAEVRCVGQSATAGRRSTIRRCGTSLSPEAWEVRG